MKKLLQYNYVKEFSCLMDGCPATCCHGWNMQINKKIIDLYNTSGNQLLQNSVTSTEISTKNGSEKIAILKRDAKTDYCINYDGGLCKIHSAMGEEYLGDACYFYPKITREIGKENTLVSATSSCPAIVSLMLKLDNPFAIAPIENISPENTNSEDANSEDANPQNTGFEDACFQNSNSSGKLMRLPEKINNIIDDSICQQDGGYDGDYGLKVIEPLLKMVENAPKADEAINILCAVAGSFKFSQKQQWANFIELIIKTAPAKIPSAEESEEDVLNLLLIFGGLCVASGKMNDTSLNNASNLKEANRTNSVSSVSGINGASEANSKSGATGGAMGLEKIFTKIEQAMGIAIARKTLNIEIKNPSKYKCFKANKNRIHNKYATQIEYILKRYINLQITATGFPFKGFGSNEEEYMYAIAIKYAIVKLCLLCSIIVEDSSLENPSLKNSASNGFASNKSSNEKINGNNSNQDNLMATATEVIFTLSRLLDHLADSLLFFNLAGKFNLLQASRIAGLINL